MSTLGNFSCTPKNEYILLFQRFIENTNVSVCMNELQSLDHREVRCRAQLAAASALLAAVEHSKDAIEICNDEYVVQVFIAFTYATIFHTPSSIRQNISRQACFSDMLT